MARSKSVDRQAKKPKGQAVQDPTGRRPVGTRDVQVVQETAEIIYNAYVTHLREHGDPSKAPTKRWNELAAVERAAFRVMNNIIRIMTLGADLLPIPKPNTEQATVTICDGNAWQSTQVNRDEISAHVIATLMSAIDKAYDENPQMAARRPGGAPAEPGPGPDAA